MWRSNQLSYESIKYYFSLAFLLVLSMTISSGLCLGSWPLLRSLCVPLLSVILGLPRDLRCVTLTLCYIPLIRNVTQILKQVQYDILGLAVM